MPPRIDPVETERFLYTILSQVDIPKVLPHSHPAPSSPVRVLTHTPRQIDWNRVAAENNISTAAAARMRWVRFKLSIKPEDGAAPTATPKRPAGNKRGSDDNAGTASPTPTPKKKARMPRRKAAVVGDGGVEAGKEGGAGAEE